MIPPDALASKFITSQLEQRPNMLQAPLKTDVWSRITRFFRHLVYSEEKYQYENLKDNILCIKDRFSHSGSISVDLTPDQYQKLRSMYHGDPKTALDHFLTNAVKDSKELKDIITTIQFPEMLPCPNAEKAKYLQVREIIHTLRQTGSEVAPQMEKDIASLKKQDNSPALTSDLEVATLLVEKVKRVNAFKSQAFDCSQAESMLTEFKAVVEESTLTQEEKEEIVKEFRNTLALQMKEQIDAAVSKIEDTFSLVSDLASFEKAFKALNNLGFQTPDTTFFLDVRQYFQNKARSACSAIQVLPVIKELQTTLTQQYKGLLEKVPTLGPSELVATKKEVQALIHEMEHPIDIARAHKEAVSKIEHLNFLLQTNTEILALLKQIDAAIPPQVIAIPSGKSVIAGTRTFSTSPKTAAFQAAAKAEGLRGIIAGSAGSAIFATIGLASGLSLPVSTVLGLGAVAALSIGSGLNTKDKYVTLLTGMTTMALFAYFGSTMVTTEIVPLVVANATIHNAVNTTLDAVLPSLVNQTINETIPAVLFSFANVTVPGLVQDTVNSTVAAVIPPVIESVVQTIGSRVIENATTTIVSQTIEEVVPAIVNNTVDAVVPGVTAYAVNHAVNATVGPIAEEVATATTPDFVSFLYERCVRAGLNEAACTSLAQKTLTPLMKEKLIKFLTPEFLNQLHNSLTPTLIAQLKDELGPQIVSELIGALKPALKEGLLTALLPQLSAELIEELPQELMTALTSNLTPAFMEHFSNNLTSELSKQLVEKLTPELQKRLQEKLAPEIFEKLLPLFTKIESIRLKEKVQGAVLATLGAAGLALAASVVAPAAVAVVVPAATVAAVFTTFGGIARILNWW